MLTIALLTLIGLTAGWALASIRAEPPWAELERELRQRHVSTDTRSLIEVARSTRDVDIRWKAIEVLGLRGEQAAKEPLRLLLGSETDRLVRETAALALARLGVEEGLKQLRSLMESATSRERQAVLAARLAELRDPSGYSFVARMAASPDPRERYTSVASLIAFVPFEGTPAKAPIDPVERLLALAKDADPRVRREVVANAPMVSQAGAVEKLMAAVEAMARTDPDLETKETAAKTILVWREVTRRPPEKH